MQENLTRPFKVALYARVSTEEQAVGQTIDSQIREIDQFARAKGWEVIHVYKDEGWSGGLLERPALDQLRDDSSRGLFNAVLLNDVDRLARDVAHLGIVKRDLERRGVRLIFRKLPDDNSPSSNLMINILGSFAEFEREMIRDRMRRGIRHKAGVLQKYVGSVAAYGYRYTPAAKTGTGSGSLEIVAEEARVVRQIYGWAAQGSSLKNIVDRLTAAGIRSRLGKRWCSSSVWKILRNEMYVGIWSYGKREACEPKSRRVHRQYHRDLKSSRRIKPRAEWLRVALPDDLKILDRDLWSRVQAQIDQNPKFSPRNTKFEYLLQGLLVCGTCSRNFAGGYCTAGGKKYFYYRCGGRCQPRRWVPCESLDTSIWNAVRELMIDSKSLEQRLVRAQESLTRRDLANREEADQARRELDRLNKEELRLLHAYRAGVIDATQLGSQLAELNQTRKPLEAKVDAVGTRGRFSSSPIAASLKNYGQRFINLLDSSTIDERQKILRALITRITIGHGTARVQARVPFPSGSATAEAGVYAGSGTSTIGSTPLKQREGNDGIAEFEFLAKITTKRAAHAPNGNWLPIYKHDTVKGAR